MPRTFADWCSVLGLALALWLLAAKPRAHVKRWALNWWAERSRASLQQRVKKLQAVLLRIESLQALTEFEDIVLRGILGIVMLLVLIPILAVMAYIMAFSDRQLALIPKDLYRQTMLTLLVFLNVLVGIGIQKVVGEFRLEHSLDYRASLRNDIAKLQARLP